MKVLGMPCGIHKYSARSKHHGSGLPEQGSALLLHASCVLVDGNTHTRDLNQRLLHLLGKRYAIIGFCCYLNICLSSQAWYHVSATAFAAGRVRWSIARPLTYPPLDLSLHYMQPLGAACAHHRVLFQPLRAYSILMLG